MGYLVSGGGGFIGSNLVEALLGRGEDVLVLDNFLTGRRENLRQAAEWAAQGGGRYELLEGDIRDPETCARAMVGREFVLHQAAIPSVPRSVQDPVGSNAVNVSGTLNMLIAAREARVRRFVFASSSSLYGESETLPKIETMSPAPRSPYALQKLTGETYCRLFHELYGVPTVALRYFNVFGPRQDPGSDYAAVVPKFVTAIRNGQTPVVYGDGEQTRDFTFITNAVQANLKACEAAEAALGEAFNIACGKRISLNRLLGMLGEVAGRAITANYAAPRAGDVKHSLADIDKARKHLGYVPSVAVREGLEQAWERF